MTGTDTSGQLSALRRPKLGEYIGGKPGHRLLTSNLREAHVETVCVLNFAGDTSLDLYAGIA